MDKPFILSVEGPGHIDKGMWSTHKILGAYATEEEALATIDPATLADGEEIILLTDLDTNDVYRIE